MKWWWPCMHDKWRSDFLYSLLDSEYQKRIANFVSFYLAVFDNGKKGPRIIVKKFHPEIEDSISIDFERFDFQSWHHYCFVFSQVAQFPYPGGYVNLTNKAYVDGVLVNEGMKMELEFLLTRWFSIVTVSNTYHVRSISYRSKDDY